MRKGLIFLVVSAWMLVVRSPCEAQKEYRAIHLNDGRVYKGEVISSEEGFLVVRTKTAEVRIPLSEIKEIVEITESDLTGATKLRLGILPAKARPSGKAVAEQIDKLIWMIGSQMKDTEVLSREQMRLMLPVEEREKFDGCGENTRCLSEVASSLRVEHLLLARVSSSGETTQVLLKSVNPIEGNVRQITLSFKEDISLYTQYLRQTIAKLIGKEEAEEKPPLPPPMEAAEWATTEAVLHYHYPSPSTALLLGLVPLPGAPCLYTKDRLNFIFSWAVTVPVTAGLVYWIGTWPWLDWGSFLLLDAAAFYGTTIIANEIFALISLKGSKNSASLRQSSPFGLSFLPLHSGGFAAFHLEF